MCDNNGLCVNDEGGYHCKCESGYSGAACQLGQ